MAIAGIPCNAACRAAPQVPEYTISVPRFGPLLIPEMFESIKADVSSNNEPADFPTLNCDLVEAEEEGNRLVASVRFHGMVSESVNAPIEPFSEVWHYVKGADTGNKWLVAGIQQG